MTIFANNDWRLGLRYMKLPSPEDKEQLLNYLAGNVGFSGFWQDSVENKNCIIVEEKLISEILTQVRKMGISYDVVLNDDGSDSFDYVQGAEKSKISEEDSPSKPKEGSLDALRSRVRQKLQELLP